MVPMTGGSSTAVKILGTALAGAMGDTTDQIISNGKVDVVRTIRSGLMSAATAAAGAVISKAVSSTAGRSLYNSKGDLSPGKAQKQVEAQKPLVKNNLSTPKGGRAVNNLKPELNASGDHSTFRTDATGRVTHYASWKPNPKNPTGFDVTYRFDGIGRAHNGVPTPHIHDFVANGGRAISPRLWQLPRGY